MGVVRQIDPGTGAVPQDVLPPEPASVQGRMSFPERDHGLKKPKNVRIRGELLRVQQAASVVLVIGIVVAGLRVQELIAGTKHRSTVGQKDKTAEILYLFAT